jgi:hypothetical protein
MKPKSLPRPFAMAARPRSLLVLAAVTLVSGLAMLPAMATMADHGASLFAFESAGAATRSAEILAGWGDAGEAAMWWQALDLPFLVGYGLFAAGACTAVAIRAERSGGRDCRGRRSPSPGWARSPPLPTCCRIWRWRWCCPVI